MSATTATASQARPLARNAGDHGEPARPQRTSKVRAPGRAGRDVRPRARPVRAVPAPTMVPASGTAARGCTVPTAWLATAPAVATASWRLTDRGIAVILVAGAMIVLAAVTVVGLMALHVTSEGYHPSPASQLLSQ